MNEQKIFDFFVEKGFTVEGIFGILGNIRDESGGNPRNLQNSYESRLGYTDDSYTEAVDSGLYKNFAHDAAGFGLAQWTYPTRKENLLRFARQQGESIGSLDMQLAFMYQEVKGYKKLFAILSTTDSIRTASDAFMTQYERPADQSESAKRRRAAYGEEIRDKLVGAIRPDDTENITEEQARQSLRQCHGMAGKRRMVRTGSSSIFIMTTDRLPGAIRSGIRMLGVRPLDRRRP